jgi:hypothetical protein
LELRPPALGATIGFGGVLGDCALPFALALALASRRRSDRVVSAVCLALILAAVLTSQTRAAVVGAVVVAFVFVVLISARRSSRAAPAVLLAAVAGAGIVIGGVNLGRYSSIAPSKLVSTFGAERGGSISLIPTYAQKYPFGAGLGTAGPGVEANASAHAGKLSGENAYTYLIIELGVPGLIVAIALFAKALHRGTRLVLSPLTAEASLYLASVTAAIAGAAVLSLSGGVTSAPPLSPYIWLGVGVIAAWAARAPRLTSQALSRS